MNLHVLERTQVLRGDVETVFQFFREPENLARITPPRLGFRILTPAPIVMKEGALLDYTIRWLGLPVRWTTFISHYEPPHLFVDVQIRGPYAFWHHLHRFRAVAGGTEMTDVVRYILPYGPLGGLAHGLLIRRQLCRIFDYRSDVIGRIFGMAGTKGLNT